jgi:transcriptional regulator with XRE-family HTH domain
MINTKDFSNRLKQLMEHHELTASSFADKISVQRSSISHILSGRNKPSLDFILKVTTEFKDVDIQWLLNGIGVFPMTKILKEKLNENNGFGSAPSKIFEKKIQRIVVFYADGTFEEYQK